MMPKPGGVVGADARMCLRVTRPTDRTARPPFTRPATHLPTIVVTGASTAVTPTMVTVTVTTTVSTVATVLRAVTASSTGRCSS